MPAAEELHSTDAVMSCVLVSLKVPVAVNCLVVPMAMLGFAGVTAIETRLAPVTVSDVLPLTAPDVAIMVVVPVPVLVARPEAFTDATLMFEEDHVTEGSCCVLPSSKIPVAINCCVVPSAMEVLAGVTEIESRCAATTVRVAVSLTAPTVAVMVTLPAPAVVTKPFPSMLAIVWSDELQATPLERSCEVPSV